MHVIYLLFLSSFSAIHKNKIELHEACEVRTKNSKCAVWDHDKKVVMHERAIRSHKCMGMHARAYIYGNVGCMTSIPISLYQV